MKKFIVLIMTFFCVIAVFSACDTQKKCAAYGVYTYYETPTSPNSPVLPVE